MEIPGKVSLYCPLVDAKGTPAKLIAISPDGYYQLEMNVKGRMHTMLVPTAHAAVYFVDPEPPVEDTATFEIER